MQGFDHQKHYDLLISTRKSMKRIKRKYDGYENHHILPKSLGGNNSKENVVALTPKEHFLAHYLLVMIYKKYKNDNREAFENYRKMTYALWNMCNGRNNKNQKDQFNCSSRAYEFAMTSKNMILRFWIKKDDIEKNVSVEYIESFLKNGWVYGRKTRSEKTRKSISKAKKGGTWMYKDDMQTMVTDGIEEMIQLGWIKGRLAFTDKHIENIKTSLSGNTLTAEHKENIRNSLKGKSQKPKTEEHKKKLGKPIIFKGIQYPGAKWAAKELNVSENYISSIIKRQQFTDCYYL
jgi:hypothetical protein